MEIIPVIDVKDRTVVRARMGQRDRYRPIETPLSPTSDPIDVVQGLFSIYPFKTLYVADLDAIEGRGDNRNILRRLGDAFPRLMLWVDNGIADLQRATDWLTCRLGDLVLGSETQADPAVVRHFAGDRRIALSLDFRGEGFQGPPKLLHDAACWPGRVIVMTLARVGSSAGPDLERLSAVKAAAAGRLVYAAGGVRDAADLAVLRSHGVAGALVATCLHDGRLRGSDIAKL
jgi:phosphoribosylformimino-5-aminoimidazole carboxamide ribotide isomerase